MRYWLFKSEPDTWSWKMQKACGDAGTEWTGVRNFGARNHMRAMNLSDRGFFYHSGRMREIVGIVEVCRVAHPDSESFDPRWECVDVRAVADFACPVSLVAVKQHPELLRMPLVTMPRLSVQPVSTDEWTTICAMGQPKFEYG